MTNNAARQVGLLPAGCQPWHMDVVAMSGCRFAYASTLAIYVYERCAVGGGGGGGTYQLHSIVAEHKKTITAIAWHTTDNDLLASAAEDRCVIVWNVSEQRSVARVEALAGLPAAIAWHSTDAHSLLIGIQRGPFLLWRYPHGNALSTPKEYGATFSSEITVCRFSDCCPGKLAVGHADGSLSLLMPGSYFHKNVLRPAESSGDGGGHGSQDAPTARSVRDLRWDPCSGDYLLCLRHGTVGEGGGVFLVDVNAPAIITSYTLPSTAVSTQAVAWIPGAVGMFLTGDKEVGVFRLWNVSKSTPIENIRINKTGFHALCVLAVEDSSHDSSSNEEDISNFLRAVTVASAAESSRAPDGGRRQGGQRASVRTEGSRRGEKWSCPPFVHALCTFMDGGVGLYNIAGKKWSFLREYGHIETIFDCKFKPDDVNGSLLATASFDGTIKVWDVETMTGVCSSAGNEGVIYQLSWAPADLDCIAAATARHGAFVWDMQKMSVVTRFEEHGAGGCVYCVAWNQRDSRRIATGGADGFVIVRHPDGKVLTKYKHPGAVYSCDWSPSNKDMLLTSCEDGSVRVYYMATGSDQPLKTFSGHTAKAFMVRWSPTKDGIFCSGSDDKTIRVWEYSQEGSVCILSGHTAPVRGLCWNTEVAHILCSGSWDCTVRLWDARDGVCLGVLADHGGDVYGLASSPKHPFVLASSSRDSTLRIWSLLPLVQQLELSVLARRPWKNVFAGLGSDSSQGSADMAILCGKLSRELKHEVTSDAMDPDLSDDPRSTEVALKKFSLFFMYPGGVQNLWDLVAELLGQSETSSRSSSSSSLSGGSSSGRARSLVVHHRRLVKQKLSAAQQMEMSRSLRASTKLSAAKDDRLAEAAELYIRLGNVQRYCEIMADLGQWQKALALAPGVSTKYWRSLVNRYADSLMESEPHEALPYCLATGRCALAVEHLLSVGAYDEAMVVAAAAREGSFYGNSEAPTTTSDPVDDRREALPARIRPDPAQLLDASVELAARQTMKEALPVVAACRYLAADKIAEALACLIKANELVLAVSISKNLSSSALYSKEAAKLTSTAAYYLALRCERLGMWELSLDVLKVCSLDYAKEAAGVCIRCNASMTEIEGLHSKARLPSMAECAGTARAPDISIVDSVRLLLLSDSPAKGLELGLQIVKEKMASPHFVVTEVDEIMDCITCFPVEKLQKAKYARLQAELLALSAYRGALLAIRRDYNTVISPLLDCVLDLMKREASNCTGLPISESTVADELTAWKAYLNKESRLCKESLDELFRKAGKGCPMSSFEMLLCGLHRVTGSQLPSHSDVHVSVFSGARIKGPAYFLEGGKSAISLNDALMWAKVNPYSPLNSGVRVNPF